MPNLMFTIVVVVFPLVIYPDIDKRDNVYMG